MAHEWRDVFSNAFLEQWKRSAFTDNVFAGNSKRYNKLLNLVEQIKGYHSIDKTAYNRLEDRRTKLKAISKRAYQLLERWGLEESAPDRVVHVKKGFDEEGKETQVHKSFYTDQSIGRNLLTIHWRAVRKAKYLKILKRYYSSRQSRSVELTRQLLGRAQKADGDLTELHPGVRLEQMDPVHRGFEFDDQFLIYDDKGNLAKISDNFVGDPYNEAFKAWFNGNHAVPFFLYLENTPVCLGDDKYDSGNSQLDKVYYSRLDKKKVHAPDRAMVCVCLVGPSSRVWFDSPINSSKTLTMGDTAAYHSKGKAQKGWAAYAFTEHCELFIVRHQEFEWHHSSFVAGNPLRCAGMIAISTGRVTGVSSHSGHYRPRPHHLYNFVKWLDNRGVLSMTAQIECPHPKFTGDWPSFKAWYQGLKG